jgi:hypothetical protein
MTELSIFCVDSDQISHYKSPHTDATALNGAQKRSRRDHMSLSDDAAALSRHLDCGGTREGWYRGTEDHIVRAMNAGQIGRNLHDVADRSAGSSPKDTFGFIKSRND